jgi:hypothetical protein
MDQEFTLPAKVFFSCEEDGFAIVDGGLMRNTLALTSIEPALKLLVGPGNVFEQRPVKLLGREGDVVSVECDGGTVVHLDFAEMLARVKREDGDFLYMGGLEDGNAGMGFMAAR